MANNNEIDDALYSRQRYVLGDSAMQRMASSDVLLCGAGGLAVEIAKNVILAGVKSFTLQDSKPATYHDLGSQFFLREEDVKAKTNRASACCDRLAELNPYVPVKTITTPLDENTDLAFLKQFQCVIVTEASLSLQLKINNFCRTQPSPIKFISADVYGVFCWSFCDFGDAFEIADPNGEDPKEAFIADVTKGNPGVVTTMEDTMHGLEDGDHVTFKEVNGMAALNAKTCAVKVLTPRKVEICDTSGAEFEAYTHGGVMCQVKTPKTAHFESLEQQLSAPALLLSDFSKLEAPAQMHVGMQALHRFQAQHGRLPNEWCNTDAAALVALAHEVNQAAKDKVSVDEALIRQMAWTARGCFSPLCAALGGVVAQEAIKALTGKFTPLNQWLYIDACEVLHGLEDADKSLFAPRQNRYDALRTCVGEELCGKLANLRLFMVGCGAIGCEMLKNYATLGVASSPTGQITITDNDLIEKSNLNRQFLFRPHHIRKPKSTTAAQSACDINPQLRIDAHQHKVCPQTEHTVYTDAFFERQDLVVNALDNLEARRYMDSRCVTNQRALLESGTMGAKGHVQVIVPHMTESYASQQDPVDHDVPYCTLKSFPAQIEHTIQWARDKFESSFTQKPNLYNKYWTSITSAQEAVGKLQDGINIEGSVQVSKLSASRPADWAACVASARLKFEKYFNHKAKHLLHAFPLDTQLKDGSLFWQSPKRPPNPIDFEETNELHVSFVRACARLYADVYKVRYSAPEDLSSATILNILQRVKVPPFRPTSKKIETDESVQKDAAQLEQVVITGDELEEAAKRFSTAITLKTSFDRISPLAFEKDDDENGHIDFITAASNLRASMYSIESADRYKTKRIAGRIVPAIATTTAAVGGLVAVELVKLLKAAPLEHYKNCFLNLALPVIVFSEPGPVKSTAMTNGISYSLWDKWKVRGNADFTVAQFIAALRDAYRVDASMIVQGVKMIYVPLMPGHKKRLAHPMLKYVKPSGEKPYIDLIVSYEGNDEDEMGPPIRYYYNG